MDKSLKKREQKVSAKTILAWNSRSISVAINIVLLMQVTYYSTEALGLSPAIVGTLFMLSRIFDGFTDLVVGFIIDKTNTKLGKARPYELFVIPLWLLSIALFSTPDMGTTGKMVYIFILYTLLQSVCSTFLQAGETVFMGRAIPKDGQRAKILSIGGVLVMIFSAASSILLPQLMANWGSQPGGWTRIALTYAVPMLLIGLIRFLVIKEQPVSAEKELKNKVGFKEGLKILTKNRYVFVLAVLILLSFTATNVLSITGSYYFTYIFGDIGLMSIVGMLGLIAPFFFLLFPLAIRTIGSLQFVRIGLLAAVVASIVRFFFPANLIVIIITTLVISFGGATLTMMNHYFILQCIDYGEIKTGKRVEGTPAAVINFAGKLGMAVASGAVGGFMALFGYINNAAVQPDSALFSMRLLYSVVPAVIYLIMVVLSSRFDVEKVLAKIRSKNPESNTQPVGEK